MPGYIHLFGASRKQVASFQCAIYFGLQADEVRKLAEEDHAAVKSNTQDVVMLDKLAAELHEAVSRFKV